MKTIIGLFDSYDEAEQAVKALQEAGFINQRISVLGRPKGDPARADDEANRELAEKAGASAIGGGIAGGLAGLLVGLGLLTIPGIGPALAAGSLAAALGSAAAGAGIGATTGGLLGALAAMGVSEERAEAYAEGVKRGGVLVMVESDREHVDMAQNILERGGAVDIDARRHMWLEDGWTHFDEEVIPPQHFPGGIPHL